MLNKKQILTALTDTAGLSTPNLARSRQAAHRTIYETGDHRGKGTGKFCIDYASFPGGTSEEVSRDVIDELERDGIIQRAYPDAPHLDAWVLTTVRTELQGQGPKRNTAESVAATDGPQERD